MSSPANSTDQGLRHLVGRKLVPFFVEDEDGEVRENVERNIGMSAKLNFEEGAESIAVRRWTENGLFEDPRRLDGTPLVSKKRQKRTGLQGNGKHSQQQGNSPNLSSADEIEVERKARRREESWGTGGGYAMPEFLVPPDAKDVPLPKFVLARMKGSGRTTTWATRPISKIAKMAPPTPGKVAAVPVSGKVAANLRENEKGADGLGVTSQGPSLSVSKASISSEVETRCQEPMALRSAGACQGTITKEVKGQGTFPDSDVGEIDVSDQDLLDMVCLTEGGMSSEFLRQSEEGHKDSAHPPPADPAIRGHPNGSEVLRTEPVESKEIRTQGFLARLFGKA
mmetsp:Transcript_2432/g.3538  ORF Transcript_2432/g.3538 Transcript_2432/m.3538 type:complete len:339 (+) Transcript_2432:139-1155(+)|eukprot:CAMPEP_0184488562 /NCGR_PEP_ID=MMETSP0113_2-20130426/12417_1 /TAXON_ID=91329 /ORGANISM="Norrisiella sphaerica, Strain BC52" /LENGTH=338 /DNA_ID=CAMNT_0026871423 /DNA_START=88 /DNA_END=1104 /DNA_ORIENTATION=-